MADKTRPIPAKRPNVEPMTTSGQRWVARSVASVRTLKIGMLGSRALIASRSAAVVSPWLRAVRTISVARLLWTTDGLGT